MVRDRGSLRAAVPDAGQAAEGGTRFADHRMQSSDDQPPKGGEGSADPESMEASAFFAASRQKSKR